MSQYADEQCSITHTARHAAKTPHKCTACQEGIQPGNIYHRDAFLYDGTWSVVRRCLRCEAIYKHLCVRRENDRTADRSEFVDPALDCGHTYRERWNGDPPPHIAALAFALSGEVVE